MLRFLYISFSLIFLFNSIFAQDEFFESQTTVGGYGELHYNYFKTQGSDAKKTLDFHRFVVFISHAWTENISFKSEVELEHNFVSGGNGELELEQAYIDYHLNDYFGVQVGVILPSVGLINEYHEPPTFLGVERPDYNKSIIPTTWFGNGISLYGKVNDIDYKLTVMEGLNGSKFSTGSGIRSGRVKGYKANADELLYNLRIDYVAINGLKAGFSYSTNNATVSDSTINANGIFNNAMNLLELHAKYTANNIYASFEYGNISYGKGELESSMGYYFDFGYNISSLLNTNGEIIPFFRWTDYNTASSTKTGGDSEKKYHNTKWMIGVSFKPIPQVVYKVDLGILKNELSKNETTLFNLGAGYMF